MKVLGKKFFERRAVKVAEDLLGKFLVVGGKIFLITETEAYEGPDDSASHASKGRTPRTEIMFGQAGIFYVYLVYGMYHMLNVVTGPKDHPAAVLIRGIESHFAKTNSTTRGERLDGPGKLTKKLKIDKKFNNKPAVPATGLWFEDRSKIRGREFLNDAKFKILRMPRVGVGYAGPVWSKKLWRFVLVKR